MRTLRIALTIRPDRHREAAYLAREFVEPLHSSGHSCITNDAVDRRSAPAGGRITLVAVHPSTRTLGFEAKNVLNLLFNRSELLCAIIETA